MTTEKTITQETSHMPQLRLYQPPISKELYEERFGFPDNIVRVTAGAGGEALLIFGSEKTALIDCGMACFQKDLIYNIHTVFLNRYLKDGRVYTLDYIFCTHSHYDHIGALAAVKKEWPTAITCASAYAKKVFSRPGAIKTMQEMSNAAGRDYVSAEEITIEFEYMQVDQVLSEGDRVSLGDESILVLETPGHTNCSLSYALEPQRILFLSESTGTLSPQNTAQSAILKHYYEGYESIRKCKAYGADRLVIPHCGLIPADFNDTYWELVKEDMESIVRFLAERQGKMTDEELMEDYTRIYYVGQRQKEQPREAFLLNAVYQLKAAAEEIERRKKSFD